MNYIFFIFLVLFSSSALSQVQDVELESIEDLEILEEFENEKNIVKETPETPINSDSEIPELDDELAVDEDILEELEIDEEFLEREDDLEELAAEEKKETKNQLSETISQNDIDKNLKPKYQNLIQRDEISLEDELNYSDTSNESIDFHQQYIKDFRLETTPKTIDQIIYAKEESQNKRFNNWEKEALKVQIIEIASSPLYIGQIYKGSKLINAYTNEVFYTQKTITVRAHSKVDSGKYKFLRSKDGSLVYKTFYKNIANINQVANMYRPPYKFKRLKKKVKKVVYDEKFENNFKLNIHTGLNNPNYTNKLLDGVSAIAPMMRVELSSETLKNNYFETGFVLMYEATSGQTNEGNSYNINSFSVGLNFLSPKVLGNFYLVVQPRFSVDSTLTFNQNDESFEVDLYENNLLVGLEQKLNFFDIGQYTLGINFQRKWYQSDRNNVLLTTNNTVSYDDSMALNLGFIF